MKEYKINEFLSLKLEGGITQIYVKGKRFLQCKRLVLNISKKDVPIYDEINSIDEATDLYQKYLYQNKMVEGPLAQPLHEEHDIPPEQEFWGHCSNLQAWYENDYDTRLLHSSLAFYLLKALVDAGDPTAKGVFKTEVAERFESGYPNTIISIVNANLLDYYSLEEKRELIRPNVSTVLKYVPKLLGYFNPEEKKELIQENKALIYEIFKKILYRPITDIFEQRLFNYLTPEDQRDIIQKNFHNLLIYIELVSKDSRFRPKINITTLSYIYLIILKAIKGTPLMDDFLKKLAGLSTMLNLQFLNAIQELKKIDKIYWDDISGSFMQLLSTSPSMLYQFLRSCYLWFPALIEDILLQILTLQNGKNIIFSIIQEDRFFIFQFHFAKLFLKVEENEIRQDILDCIEKIWSLKNERIQLKNKDPPKIVLFGEDFQGKTTLVNRYLTKVFDKDLKMTIGADFYAKDLEIDGKNVVLRIWDFGGEKRFKVLLPSFAKGAAGGIFVFDITRYTSVKNIDDWLSIFEKNYRMEIPIIMVGILTDGNNMRSVETEDANELAKKFNFSKYLEISTSTGKNIETMFEELTRLVMKKRRRGEVKKLKQKKDLEMLVDCKKCGKFLTLKLLYTLLKKERVYCPNCGRFIHQKFNPRERLVYLKRVLEVSPTSPKKKDTEEKSPYI